MARRVTFLPAVRTELAEACGIYGEAPVPPEPSLWGEIDRGLQQVVQFPASGARHAGFRRLLLKRFPYAIIYEVLPDRIRVIALTHTSRRPGHWRKRVTKK